MRILIIEDDPAIAANLYDFLDHEALRFVLANLIRNAVSYTERGFVEIAYAAKRLTVADSGRGISAEHLPRIFERFFAPTAPLPASALASASPSSSGSAITMAGSSR